MCLDATIDMLKSFPLRVEQAQGQIIATLDGQNVNKGPLQ